MLSFKQISGVNAGVMVLDQFVNNLIIIAANSRYKCNTMQIHDIIAAVME